jgi:hypothetical protein
LSLQVRIMPFENLKIVYIFKKSRRVHQHGNHLKYQKVLKQVGIIYPRFPDLKKDKNHVGK